MAGGIDAVVNEIYSCKNCSLHLSKRNYVPGEGNENAQVMFIGEAPGREEDEQGRPFVGNAGKLLTDMIETVLGISRKDVYITNILKCRPPDNRDPMEDEIDACFPFLVEQIMAVEPEVIVCLGRHSAKVVFDFFQIPFRSITTERGVLKEKEFNGKKLYIMATYHPAAALYRPPLRDIIQDDFKKLTEIIKRKNKTLFDFFS